MYNKNNNGSNIDPCGYNKSYPFHVWCGNVLCDILISICEITLEPLESNSSHYNDVIMGAIASQITSLTIGYSTIYSGADQRKHESSASLAWCLIFAWTANIIPYRDLRPPYWLLVIVAVGNCPHPVKKIFLNWSTQCDCGSFEWLGWLAHTYNIQ